MTRKTLQTLGCAMLAAIAVSAMPAQAANFTQDSAANGKELPPYLQCVPYARQVSGISIYGDAHTWWNQAQGRYRRGNEPKVGAVMAFRPHGNMRLGHVAAVSKIVDARTILLRHANWSEINGRRGQIEDDVKAVDVSPANDWSEVRVWYDPIQALGGTAWPVHGFIYNGQGRIQYDRGPVAGAGNASARHQVAARYSSPKARRDVIGSIITQTRR